MLKHVSRVRSFAMSFNYIILNYLSLIYTLLFDRNFIIHSTWLSNYHRTVVLNDRDQQGKLKLLDFLHF